METAARQRPSTANPEATRLFPTPAAALPEEPTKPSDAANAFHDGLVTGLYAVRDPEKLSRMQRETVLSR
ncbi:hypothetical protein IU427_26765 [Nocardia beijingensis]|uniref:hypothetical protein n=1 Tax=Nocardia beijingensis TaxID=95162 RepID=UPI00189516B3|nr:hypothetical protein [Nocardia beijingensis]MBF6468739.1 hypothetical protein [Nocardia beijingensis]